ncbi:MAG: hypothetical protein V4570_02755 [Pseudomonadota bacterium]
MKTILLSCLLVICVPVFAQTTDVNNDYGACNKHCVPVNLTRGELDKALTRSNVRDDLSINRKIDELESGKQINHLMRSSDSTQLQMGRKTDRLNRGSETELLQMSKVRDDLSRGYASNDLTRSQKTGYLSRNTVNDNLSFSRVRDDLSRGRDSAILSRCE